MRRSSSRRPPGEKIARRRLSAARALSRGARGSSRRRSPGFGSSAEAADGFEVTFEGGVPEGPRTIAIGAATVSPESYRELWRRTFRNGAPFLQEVTLRRDLGQRVLAFARGEVRVDDRHSRLRVPLPAPRASALADALRPGRRAARAGPRDRRRPGAGGAGRGADLVPRDERLAGRRLRRDRVAGRISAPPAGRRRGRRSRRDVLRVPADADAGLRRRRPSRASRTKYPSIPSRAASR